MAKSTVPNSSMRPSFFIRSSIETRSLISDAIVDSSADPPVQRRLTLYADLVA
jgi:hypothetical protein